MPASSLVLGLDAGGTKTDAVICDRSGLVRGVGTSGNGNWEYEGLERARASLEQAVGAALAAAGAAPAEICSAVFALAGIDWPVDLERLDPVVAAFGFAGRRQILNDSFAALRAGCRQAHGVVSLAGTASVTAGRNRAGETFRTLAIGYGERGGGQDLVRAGLAEIARSRHGEAPPTLLEPRYLEALGLASDDDLFFAISRERLRPPATLAPMVLQAAADGDAAALAIVREQGEGLAATVAGVARRLGMQDDAFEVVRAGGIHRAGSAELDAAFLRVLGERCPSATPVLLAATPAAGAALLALEALGPVSPEVHDRVLAGVAGSIVR